MSMRWSCIAAFCSALLLAPPVPADSLGARLGLAPPDPVLVYTLAGQEVALMPRDVAAIEISESGGITDVFVRLALPATDAMTGLMDASAGQPMTVRVCDVLMLETVVAAPTNSGTLYIPGTNALRAEGMRALWHGRARCDTLGPEVFEHVKQ
ncbi:hypothetical protein [Roseicyclus amphidinii]|uniref:hypothetical protein n=1 Tax=Roseicyclus amphidinii TaxID=3034232 RepID=UPI0024E16378|nr:hypothetical protein [Roseicyclus sp. Amp-Y-6]